MFVGVTGSFATRSGEVDLVRVRGLGRGREDEEDTCRCCSKMFALSLTVFPLSSSTLALREPPPFTARVAVSPSNTSVIVSKIPFWNFLGLHRSGEVMAVVQLDAGSEEEEVEVTDNRVVAVFLVV